jgi:transmembrane sensor
MSTYRDRTEQRLIGEQAASWLCDLAEGDPKQHEAFLAWIRRSPRHVAQFLEVSAAWKAFGKVRPFNRQDILAMIEEARTTRDDSNVVTMSGIAPAEAAPSSRERRWRRPATIAASAGLVAIGSLVATGIIQFKGETYSTNVAEQRAVRLTDGSLLHLNTRSRIEVQFSADARDVKLMEGEALFNVRGNPARPFRVEVEGVVIEAIGTQFNVQRKDKEVTVSVIDGRVSINGQQELGAGQQARVGVDERIAVTAHANVADAIAWRERRLVFEDVRLEDIAADVNRYTPGYLRLEDQAARDKRITGTFDADDPESLVMFLQGVDGVEIDRTKDGVMIRGTR